MTLCYRLQCPLHRVHDSDETSDKWLHDPRGPWDVKGPWRQAENTRHLSQGLQEPLDVNGKRHQILKGNIQLGTAPLLQVLLYFNFRHGRLAKNNIQVSEWGPSYDTYSHFTTCNHRKIFFSFHAIKAWNYICRISILILSISAPKVATMHRQINCFWMS